METIIQIQHLQKHFGNLKVLNDVDFDIHKGEVVTIIGSSGSGKSTLLRCIHGLEHVDTGKIYLDDEWMNPDDEKKFRVQRNRMGFVFQHFNLFPNMSVLQNCKLAQVEVLNKTDEEAEKIALEYLDKVGLLEKKDAYPNNLSGGQKQRVAIARALCMNPDIMLFDEPTSALDPEMIGEVLDLIKMVASENKTMIIVSHEISFVKSIANRILFLENGKIIFDGSNKEFFNNKNDRIKAFLQKVKK